MILRCGNRPATIVLENVPAGTVRSARVSSYALGRFTGDCDATQNVKETCARIQVQSIFLMIRRASSGRNCASVPIRTMFDDWRADRDSRPGARRLRSIRTAIDSQMPSAAYVCSAAGDRPRAQPNPWVEP
jgi:hypothetical protein